LKARDPGRRSWEHIKHTCLKVRIFWKKNVKIASASGDPSPDLRFVTPSYYYTFVEFVSKW